MAEAFKLMQATIDQLNKDVEALKSTATVGTGVTYKRWGRATCPVNGTTLLYSGIMSGPKYNHAGGGTNLLCLPEHPSWAQYKDGNQNVAQVWGTEMASWDTTLDKMMFGRTVGDMDMPCSLCESSRSQMVMLPGHTACYPGWTLEYSGYVIGPYGGSNVNAGADYVCIDASLEFVPGGGGDDNENLIMPVEVQCGILPCPPYVQGRELACVVCTK